MILHVAIAVAQGITGLLLLSAGGYGVVLQRRMRAARRRATSVEALDAALQRWRLEKRLLRARALQAWQADFDALLPPAPPCTSTSHNHVENVRLGSGRVEVICVERVPASMGGITVQEAVQALQRIAVPQRVVLSPGEHVLSADEAIRLAQGRLQEGRRSQEARLRMLEAYRRGMRR